MSEENDGTVDDGATGNKVELEYDGEVVQTIDLSTPESLVEAKRLMEQGLFYTKNKDVFLQYKEKAKNAELWEARLEAVKTGVETPEHFIGDLEKVLGRNLTKSEKNDISFDMDDDDMKKLQSLVDDKFKALDAKLDEQKIALMANDIQKVHDKLSGKYSGSNGYPKYNPDNVQRWIDENKLYSPNIALTYEQAYIAMNREKIFEAERNIATGKNNKMKRENVKINDGNGKAFNFGDKPINVKRSYSNIALEAAQRLKDKGISLFTDD